MTEFNAALPKVVKFSTGENKYDTTGKNPVSLSLFVPVESAFALAQYLMNVADDASRHKTGKVWNYDTQSEEEVQGFYINGKGREGRDGGTFGNINPAALPTPEAAF